MTARELFDVAANGDSKAERRNAFRQLRELSLCGEVDVAAEASFALANSVEYERMIAAGWIREHSNGGNNGK